MLHKNVSINSNLAQAANLLAIGNNLLRNDHGEAVATVSAMDHAKSLVTYLNLAGYFHEDLIQKAVAYLASAKPFQQANDQVSHDLLTACHLANQHKQFNAELFLQLFAKEKYFAVSDIIDLITFFQQTAFDRQFGVERDRLQAKPWLEQHKEAFTHLAIRLGVVNPLYPLKKHYLAVGLMGASSKRVKKRLQYFANLPITSDYIFALTGNRELSKGLDEEDVMQAVATYLEKPVTYVQKSIGADNREFLAGITETMMVNYLLQTTFPKQQISVIDSAVEDGHWRATTSQSAMAIATVLINKIKQQKVPPAKDNNYHFLMIADQPYAMRMAKQVQREFNKAILQQGLEKTLSVTVEACGPGVLDQDLENTQTLTGINSELAALMAERFNDARLILQQQGYANLRDSDFIMFAKRDTAYKAMAQQVDYSNARPQLK